MDKKPVSSKMMMQITLFGFPRCRICNPARIQGPRITYSYMGKTSMGDMGKSNVWGRQLISSVGAYLELPKAP